MLTVKRFDTLHVKFATDADWMIKITFVDTVPNFFFKKRQMIQFWTYSKEFNIIYSTYIIKGQFLLEELFCSADWVMKGSINP